MNKVEYRWVKRFENSKWEPAKFVWDEHSNLVELSTFNTSYFNPQEGLRSLYDFQMTPIVVPE